ncbi:hypothetical protein [Devosia sp. 2618]|uniref:hypothetical protein n=1 Tax=Devosia sp. 2618 TaxID=3156454 RepID=UPI003392695C
MFVVYRVIDMRAGEGQPVEITIENVRSPEEAVRKALGLDVVRSGNRNDLVARVYWQAADQPVTMVRLYRRLAN